MRTRLFFLIFSFSLASSFSALADELALKDLIETALKNNPQIQVAQARYEASKARIPQASSLADPRFEFKYDKMTASMDAVMEGKTAPMRVFGLSQEIPFPTKLLLRAQIAAKESQMAHAEYLEKEKEIISIVKSLFAELSLIYKSIEIIKENKVLLEQLFQTALTSFSLNKTSQQDVLKIQVEIAKMDNELIMLEQKRQVLQAKLNILLDQEPSAELGEVKLPGEEFEEDAISLEALNRITKENRQELKAFRLAVDRARKTVALARQEYLPDFMVKYERMERDSRLTDWAGMVGVTLPLWFWQKQNFNVKEMRAELKVMEVSYRDEENQVLLDVKAAYSEKEASKKIMDLYRTTYLPQAEQTLKASLIGYEANQVDILNVLDSQRMLLDFKLDYYRALVDYEVASAELERSVGKPLDRS